MSNLDHSKMKNSEAYERHSRSQRIPWNKSAETVNKKIAHKKLRSSALRGYITKILIV